MVFYYFPYARRNASLGQWLRHLRSSASHTPFFYRHHHHQTSILEMDRPAKRTKISPPGHDLPIVGTESLPAGDNGLASLHRSITPPPQRRQTSTAAVSDEMKPIETPKQNHMPTIIYSSPIQLTHIRDLPASSGNNVDTIRLRDILGDPMIRECWQFNFLIDVDFLMSQFDEDVRDLVKVKVVHGSWKRDAPNRIRIDVLSPSISRLMHLLMVLQEQCSRYPNVESIVAYMPEPFGTHHSKMMILLRHDDLAQYGSFT